MRRVVIATLLGLAAALGGCGDKPSPAPAAEKAPDQTYTVRGKILKLPDPALPASDLQIQHEPIPNFVDKDGKVVGMRAMAMPFPVAPGVSLTGLAVDDLVEFTFEVRWGAEGPRWRVTRIAELPAGTALDFGPPKGG